MKICDPNWPNTGTPPCQKPYLDILISPVIDEHGQKNKIILIWNNVDLLSDGWVSYKDSFFLIYLFCSFAIGSTKQIICYIGIDRYV